MKPLGRRWSEVVKGGKYRIKQKETSAAPTPTKQIIVLPRGVPLPKSKFVPSSPPLTDREDDDQDQVTFQPEEIKMEEERKVESVEEQKPMHTREEKITNNYPQYQQRYSYQRKRSFFIPQIRKKTIFVWLDLENTGLERSTNHILEISVLFSDPSLRDLGIFSEVRHLDDPDMETWSRNTHNKNGLSEAVANSKKSIEQIDQELCDFVQRVCQGNMDEYELMPCGVSINNDLKFLESELPNFFSLLHHETLELSGIRKLVRLFCPRLRPPPRFVPLHRAVPDVYSAFQLFLFYLPNLFKTHTRRLLEHNIYQEHINRIMEDSSEYSFSWSVVETTPTYEPQYPKYQPQPTTYFTPYYPQYVQQQPQTSQTTTGPIYAYPTTVPTSIPNTEYYQPYNPTSYIAYQQPQQAM